MGKNEVVKPLTEQVLDEMINNIKNKEEFDNDIIVNLSNLVREGNLKKVEQVINAIKPKKED